METRQLRLLTTQKYETHEDSDEMLIDAVVAKRGKSTYITFKQPIPEHQVEISNIVKLKDNKVYVKRSGALSSDLEFDIQKEYVTTYENEYGLLDIRIKTERIESFIVEDIVRLELRYEVSIQGKKVSDNIYTITSEGVDSTL